MDVDLIRFKVVYNDRILKAIAIIDLEFEYDTYVELGYDTYDDHRKTIEKAKSIEILAVNEDGNIVSIYDEALKFQFLPIISD